MKDIPVMIGVLLAAAAPAPGHGCAPGPPGACAAMGPLRSIHAYLSGFHFYNGAPSRQLAAHHYCARVSPEVMQCVIYDSSDPDARLVGIEYIVSARLFRTFSAAERKLWHSHRFEVTSGQLVAPGLTEAAEKVLMKELVLTYGKTWQTWHVDRNGQAPLGIPQLLMGFTAEGQIDPGRVAARDREAGLSSAARKARRSDLPSGPIEPGADAWQRGDVLQLRIGPMQEVRPAVTTGPGAGPGPAPAGRRWW